MPRMLLGALALLAVVCSGQAEAQTAPSPAELAAYRGLHAAAVTGNAAAIRQLAAAGSDLDARDGNGRTPLHVAAFQGRAEAARLLIASGAKPGLLDDQRYDAVTIAAVRDDVPMVKALLASGASAKLITSRYDGTALIAAAHLGHDRVVRALIEAGAPLDHINNLGWTALMESVVLGDGGPRHVETARALLAAGADRSIADGQGVTPLRHARARGYQAMAEALEKPEGR
ncbi:ankyrin repeat domain-containing protein [Bosea sp. RAF48]|uniref:ankyrin repeat domain-containing protein n=1 Tax=Bosea sp. RAF48 TaxID=3237480 RepID=UPI003F9185B3